MVLKINRLFFTFLATGCLVVVFALAGAAFLATGFALAGAAFLATGFALAGMLMAIRLAHVIYYYLILEKLLVVLKEKTQGHPRMAHPKKCGRY